jgi:uncharacterized glyoxalase superfamily protein PhnB
MIDRKYMITAGVRGLGVGGGERVPSQSATSTQSATPPPQVWPTLRARDAQALIDFLVEAFGFVEVCAFDDGHGGIVHAQLAWPPGGGIMLGSGSDRAEDVHARATAAGATVVQPMNETDYGSRGFSVTDPEGNFWSFGTYRGEPVPRAR